MQRELQEQLILMKKNMDELADRAEKFLSTAPERVLRVNQTGKSFQYYVRNNPKDTHGKYISKEQKIYIQQLAQKEYAKRVLTAARKNGASIQQFLNGYQEERIDKILDKFQGQKRELIVPYILTNEEYADKWQQESIMTRNDLPRENQIFTEKGEVVRSKSEKILADKFKLENIPYHYEKELYLRGYGKVYPDFILLNKRTRKEFLWEHLGRMDDPNYCEKAIKKLELMQKNGIIPGKHLLLTYETSAHPLNMKIVEQLIKEFLL